MLKKPISLSCSYGLFGLSDLSRLIGLNGYPLHPRKFQGSSFRQGASWSHHGQWLEFVRDPVHSSCYGTKCMVNDRIFAAKCSWFLSLPVRHWYFLATGATGVKGIPTLVYLVAPGTPDEPEKPDGPDRPGFSRTRRPSRLRCAEMVSRSLLQGRSFTERLSG